MCTLTKQSKKKYGHLPEKEAKVKSWDKLCVDLIGLYTVKRKNKDPLTLWAITPMIDPATGWFKMRELKDKDAYTTANIVEQTWLACYLWSTQIVFDKETEFMAEFAKMVKKEYECKRKGAPMRKSQANSMIKRIHQTIGNMICTFETYNK